ncbi:hypothetical protein [Microbacterium maritypicum]
MTERVVRYLADTGYLICFGAIPGGQRLFMLAFSGTVAASPTIRFELGRKHSDWKTEHHVKTAINTFIGKNHNVLLDVTFHRRDEPERDNALAYMRSAGSLPTEALMSFPVTADGHDPGTPDTQKHGGEAEIVAIAARRLLPLLMNDRDGTDYAAARRLEVESFARSLGRLLGPHTPNELFQIWKRVDANHDTGAVVPGPQFFRQPGPSPTARIARASGLA